MKKFFTLMMLFAALTVSAKEYTLSELASIVGTIENVYEKNGENVTETVGILTDGNVYTLILPTKLADGVTGIGFDDNNIVLGTKYLTLVAGNDLTISAGETLLFGTSAQLEMSGILTATNATFGAAEGAEAKAKGFRVYGDNTGANLSGCTFNYVNINFGSTSGKLVADNCVFSNTTNSGGNSAINFTSSCSGNEVTNCQFINCALSGVASGANVGVGAVIKDCTFQRDFAITRLYPHINMTTSDQEIVIDGNTIIGAKQTTRSGGIAVSNLLGGAHSGKVYITNNHVEGNSYGITLTGKGDVVIENNTVVDNKYIADPNQGGSGINVTCNVTTGDPAKAFLRGNLIEGNTWGVTVIGNVDINAGKVDDPNAEDYNPGENIFINNGNNDVLYDWYNNTAATSYAQGNKWNVEEQTQELIEGVIVHKVDNPDLGEVIFMPPYKEKVQYNCDVNGDGHIDIDDVNIVINAILEQ